LVSKLNLAIIAAIACGGMIWVERGHHISTDAPTSTELDTRAAAVACPNSDSMPYTVTCLVFMGSSQAPDRGGSISLTESATSLSASKHNSTECPDNDNKPYPPACVRFLSGWFWRPN